MRQTNQIVLASTNLDKLAEFRAMMTGFQSIEILPAQTIIFNAGKIGHVEKFNNYLDNAIAKASLVNRASHYPSLADDSGLEVAALNGQPGVFSARYAEIIHGESQDKANTTKLLEALKGYTAQKRTARFVATLVLVIDGIMIHSTGVLEGKIAEEPKGSNGFGYDPIFIPEGSERTLAEMRSREKNTISHRAKALAALMQQVQEKHINLAKP